MISQLNQREQIFVGCGAVAVGLVLLYLLLLSPYQNAMNRLDDRIASRRQQLQEVHSLRQQYLKLQQEASQIENRLSNRRDFSALTFIENLVAKTAGRENLLSMRPQAPVTRDQFIQEAIEIKLEQLTYRQVLELLWGVEKADFPMQVSDLYLKQRFDDRSLLDATMTVTALRRSS
ncbi:MAG TPA: type II secretion system protein GspM [Desulfuromonadales bacterium]|nr:type II secretion system protein GspM [Desulfuromonadales bacterium]